MTTWKIKDRKLEIFDIPLIMGILNVTPDSFSDGGSYIDPDKAMEQVRNMMDDGVDIIDVGGESTRPGAVEVSADEELSRVIPIIKRISENYDIPISVDTYKASVARESMEAGAHIINDVYGFMYDPDMARVASETSAGVVLMSNATMREDQSEDIIRYTKRFFKSSYAMAHEYGIKEESILFDPGVGFGTTRDEDLTLLRNLQISKRMLLGVSRKRVVSYLLGGRDDAKERDAGSAGIALAGAMSGIKVIRVHNVRETRDVFDTFFKIAEGQLWMS